MQKYDIIVLETADRDLDDIIVYLSNFSPNIAQRYYDEITIKMTSLTSMPNRYPLVRDELLSKKGIRWVFAKNYVIFFTVDESESIVYIERILYSRMAYDVLL